MRGWAGSSIWAGRRLRTTGAFSNGSGGAEQAVGARTGALVQKLKASLGNLLTVIASLAILLLAAEIVLRFLPFADAPPVESPSIENLIQRYVANRAYTWSLGWNLSNVVRGRSN